MLRDVIYRTYANWYRISEKWNEYIINDEGTRLKLKSTVTKIKKSDIVIQNCDPIYNVRIKILSKIIKPKLNN